jgi:hypothetical protein
MTWLTNWNYRKLITISNAGSILSDYQILLTIDTATLIAAGKLLLSCNDIRFTSSDETTLLNYWIESGCNSSSTNIWVKIPSILSSPLTTTIYMYYGNATPPIDGYANNGTNTFEFFSTSLIGTGDNSASPLFGNNYALRGNLRFTANWQTWGFCQYGESKIALLVNTGNDPDVQFWDGWYYNTIGPSLNIGHPYKIFDIIRNGTSNVIVRVDNGSQTTQTYRYSNAYKIETNGAIDHNWSLVRKYISPEPTFFSIGIEEAPTTPANITIEDITVGEIPCISGCDLICINDCPAIVDVVVTWGNSGGSNGTFIPTVTVTPPGTITSGQQITVASMETRTTTLTGVILPHGTLNVCVDTGIIT